MSAYDLADRFSPVVKGPLLSAAAATIEHPLLGPTLAKLVLADAGLSRARPSVAELPPSPRPSWPAADEGEPEPLARVLSAPPALAPAPLPMARARDYHELYRGGALSPEQVAERALSALEAAERLTPPLRAFIAADRDDVRRQAAQSALRFREGRPLSVLDGVPVAIKDEVDQTPYPTSGGTTFLGRAPAVRDATVVARLRAAGALLIGKTNMYEIGIQPAGSNLHFGQVRNPYDRACEPGGSSSGSAAAVAAGLCPIAIGADGGGSIRVPAALCGVVGLKPTFGRVSEVGAVPLCWSVAHLGPLAASVEDAALAYAAIAGPDPDDAISLAQPPPSLEGFERSDLAGVRLGVFRAWFEHAEPAIVRACQTALDQLASLGASITEIRIPGLETLRVAHAITILSEMAASLAQQPESPRAHAPAVRVILATARQLRAVDYVWAQRARTQAMRTFAEVFKNVDAIVTPTTAITAPRLPDPMPPEGWLDVASTLAVMRFIVPGNFLGLPALTVPVGYDACGLPIGLQLTGRAWQEALLLRAGRLLEGKIARRRPATYYDLLAAAS